MKGLLLNDFYTIMKYLKPYFLIVFVFSAVSVFSNDSLFFCSFPMIITSVVLPISLISYDERSKWNIFCDTLPVSRKNFVSSKYIISIIACVFAASIMIVGQLIRPLITNSTENMVNNILTLMLFMPSGLIMSSVIMPLIYKFGVEKARIIYYTFLVVSMAVIGSVSAIMNMKLYEIKIDVPAIVVALSGASIVLFALSWLLSVKIYQKREL